MVVQELAASVKEPPSQYVLGEQNRLLVVDQMAESVPIIDLSRLAAADEADKLRAALQSWGLFQVIAF